MASQGPLGPGAGTDDSSLLGQTWTNPGNVTAADSSNASVVLAFSQQSHWLRADNFGFSIPNGSTIDGIYAEWLVSSSTEPNKIYDAFVKLFKAGVAVGTNKGGLQHYSTTPGYLTYGGPSDLWGTTWTVDQINASGFGCGHSAGGNDFVGSPTAYIDYCRITVYYTASSQDTPELYGRPFGSHGQQQQQQLLAF